MASLHWMTSGLLVIFTDITFTSLLDIPQYSERHRTVKMEFGTLEAFSNTIFSSASMFVM